MSAENGASAETKAEGESGRQRTVSTSSTESGGASSDGRKMSSASFGRPRSGSQISENARVIILAVDASEYAKYAFECEYYHLYSIIALLTHD